MGLKTLHRVMYNEIVCTQRLMWLFVCEYTHLMFTHVHLGTTLKTPTLHTLTSGKSQWSCQWGTPQERDSPSQTPWSPVSYYLLACRLAAWKEREEGRRRRRRRKGGEGDECHYWTPSIIQHDTELHVASLHFIQPTSCWGFPSFLPPPPPKDLSFLPSHFV